jgi:DNA-binding MarR family transcriptional regulator
MAELENMPGYLFRVLENKSNSLFQNALAEKNLTTRQFGVLNTLARHGVMTQTELAERTSSDKSTLGEMLVRMRERGLLTRKRGADRRSIVIALTDDGRRLVLDVVPVVVAMQKKILEALPEEYRMLFMKCLKQLAATDFETSAAA